MPPPKPADPSDLDPADPAWADLLHAARSARLHAHAPYSGYSVGAALRDEHGRIHAGCNIENAAYPQGLCAEAAALSHLVVAGGVRITAALVMGEGTALITPCGGCRQKLREFAADDVPVACADLHTVRAVHTLGALLPAGFGPAHLAVPDQGGAA